MQPGGFTEADVHFATRQLESIGLRVSFGHWVLECNEHLTASRPHRLDDLHAALRDPSVRAILAVSGGVGAIQLLDGIDYDLVAAHPKILCGYSDIAYLCYAMGARAGLTTFYGPNFTGFMMRKGCEYTLANFRRCLFENETHALRASELWSDDAWHKDQENRVFQTNDGFWPIQEGAAAGAIQGGNCWCLNMLQGSQYFPSLDNSILFLEQPSEGKATLMALECGLRALSFQPAFSGVRAIVLGRYSRGAGVTRENLTALLSQNPALNHLPVIANVDFGHTTPVITLPIGGRCRVKVTKEGATITLIETSQQTAREC
jgi:muramoyltetrapeptide carboxypeptidase LdcA involved in peptidoglycan recycling